MPQIKFSMLVTVVLCSFSSVQAWAAPGAVAILAVDNKAALSPEDASTLFGLVETPFKLLPANEYTIGTLKPAAGSTPNSCGEACMVLAAGKSGADYAVYSVVMMLGGRALMELRLYDAKSGRLIGREITEPEDDISKLAVPVDWAAKKLIGALRTASRTRATLLSRAAPASVQSSPVESTFSSEGMLRVTSTPSDASVAVGGRLGQRFIGKTPLEKSLTPHRYRVVVSKKGYPDEQVDVHLFPGESESVHVDLYKSKFLMRAGHATLWPGIILLIPAAALFSTGHKEAGIAFFAMGGTMFAAGATLLTTGALRLKKEKKNIRNRLTFDVRKDRFSFCYSRIF